MSQQSTELEWYGCFDRPWARDRDIVAEAFAHPAKYARNLIFKIYEHAHAKNWLRAGDSVLDPFGGVAMGGLPAYLLGAHWTGVELEEKFVRLGERNIQLWMGQYSMLGTVGSARLLRGDSRCLLDVIGNDYSLAASSPPYTANVKGDYDPEGRDDRREAEQGRGCFRGSESYGESEGQMGRMTEGDFGMAVSSPPYNGDAESGERHREREERRAAVGHRNRLDENSSGGFNGGRDYGTEGGQLGTMSEGSFSAAVSSPPYADGCRHTGGEDTAPAHIEGSKTTAYGADYGVAISSPPYDKSGTHPNLVKDDEWGKAGSDIMARQPEDRREGYVGSEGQMGGADDFWSAARLVLEQTYAALKPNGHAIFVCKRYVRNREIVEFPQQWAELCRAVGFKDECWHRAWFTREHGTQLGLLGEDKEIRTQKKSFFRALAEKHGSPRIDWEDVMCFSKD